MIDNIDQVAPKQSVIMIKSPATSGACIFKTQGTAHELNASRIGAIDAFIALNEPAIPIPLQQQHQSQHQPRPQPQKQPQPVQPPQVMLVRKSTLYQETPVNSYVKYGNSDDEDGASDTGCKPGSGSGSTTINFDDIKLKQAMASMTTAMNVSTPVGRVGVPKKRFPVPASSSTSSQLFWCAYIACKGEAAFDMISNAFVCETQFKYETVDALRGIRHLAKPMFKRYKLSLPNFEAELISSKRTTLQVMTGIVICHQKNLLYIDHRMFIEIKANDDLEEGEREYVVIEKVKNRYCVYTDVASVELTRCRAELLKMESLDTPVRSSSYYKVRELEDICKRLALVVPATGAKKADLYSEILKYVEISGVRV